MMFKGMAYLEGDFTRSHHRWSMNGGLSELEQAIEDRYWGRKAGARREVNKEKEENLEDTEDGEVVNKGGVEDTRGGKGTS